MLVDVLGCVMLLLFSIIMGLMFYFTREEMGRSLRYVSSILLTLFMALVASFLLMSHVKVSGLLEGFVLHTLLVAVFWVIYLYCYRSFYRLSRFFDADKDDYSIKAYLKWRKFFMRRERDFNDRIDGEDKALNVGTVILCFTIIVYVITLFAIYSPSPAISSDFAIEEDSISMAVIDVPKGAKFYSGLPTSDDNLIWETPADLKLLNAKAYLVTDKGDVQKKYWMIKIDDLSKENKARLPFFFDDYDLVVVESWTVTTQRDFGQIIVP